MPSICFVAGDPSGDAHAARLVTALANTPGPRRFTGLGGPAMQAAGVELVDDLTRAAAIGPFDAFRHLSLLRRARARLEAHLRAQPPDLVLLVDFGDFNLPVIAPLAKRLGLRVAYYISPQIWAWGRWRLRLIRRYVDRMIVLFPFEEAQYRAAGVPVTWVGHPLVDAARPSVAPEEARQRFRLNPWRRTVGLLPGSREDELRRHLPLLLNVARRLAWRMPGLEFLLPLAPGIPRERLQPWLAGAGVSLHVAEGPIYDALQLMDAAVVASGTATLETAICQVPMAVVYRASWPTYLLARAVVRVRHVAIVNILAGRAVVPEFVQHRAQPGAIAEAMLELLRSEERRNAMRADLGEIRARLGPPGAVERAAAAVRELSQA